MNDRIVATTEQIRLLDRIACEKYGIPGIILMENAGRGAAEIAFEMIGVDAGGRVLIMCGRGNNGGDGFVIGRHLHNRGLAVEFVLAARQADVDASSDAGKNLAIVRKMGLPIREVVNASQAPSIAQDSFDLIIDALLGTGLSGDVREPTRTLIEMMNGAGAPVLAVDTPSGLDTDTGRVLGAAVRATRTATFAAAKRGFYLAEGPAHVGDLSVVDIGIPRELLATLPLGDHPA